MTEPATVTVAEVCAILGLSEPTVLKAIKRGLIPGYQLGGKGSRIVIPRPAFDAFLAGEWIPQPRPVEPIRPLRPVGLTRKAG